jgi:hypothetical protein
MSKHRVFYEENELGDEILSLYKYIPSSFWQAINEIITGNEKYPWQFVRSFSNYKEVDKYARSKGWVKGDIFD